MTDANKIMHPRHFGTDLTDIESGLIRKSRFKCQITFVSTFVIGAGLHSLSAIVVCFYQLVKGVEGKGSVKAATLLFLYVLSFVGLNT